MPKSGSFVDRRAEFDVLEAVSDLLDGLDDGDEYSDVLAAFLIPLSWFREQSTCWAESYKYSNCR